LGIMKCELIDSLGWVGLGAPVCWEFSREASSWFGFFDFVLGDEEVYGGRVDHAVMWWGRWSSEEEPKKELFFT
jgi:hypothetical protein